MICLVVLLRLVLVKMIFVFLLFNLSIIGCIFVNLLICFLIGVDFVKLIKLIFLCLIM